MCRRVSLNFGLLVLLCTAWRRRGGGREVSGYRRVGVSAKGDACGVLRVACVRVSPYYAFLWGGTGDANIEPSTYNAEHPRNQK